MNYFHFFQKLIFIFLLLGAFLPILAQEGNTAAGESTESVLPNATLAASPTSSETPSPTTPPKEATAEATEALSSEVTETITEATEASLDITEASFELTETLVVPSPAASPTLGADRWMRGRVTYQIGENHAGILIQADDGAGWQSRAISDEHGIYEIALRSDRAFRLDFSASLYLRQTIWLVTGDSAPAVLLLGGDLNGDDCINSLDLNLMLPQFDKTNTPGTDLNFDGMTDVIDLVILTSNMNAECEPPATSSSETALIENGLFPTATGTQANP